jgi:hypothetical protein
MLKSYLSQLEEAKMAARGSILLVEPDKQLCQSRALLLSILNLPIQKASGYSEVCSIPTSAVFSIIAISLNPREVEAAKIATYARGQWAAAKILLLGRLTEDFDDPLYDEIVDPNFNPAALVEAAKRLLKDLGANPPERSESYEL